MHIKRSGGKIFGAVLTAAEQKAMRIEIHKALVEYDRRNLLEMDALVLWVLHEHFGFGKKRLKEFYDCFVPEVMGLIKRYELDDTDHIWICTRKLKEYGIDLEEWKKERKQSDIVLDL